MQKPDNQPPSDEEVEFIFDSNQLQIKETQSKICQANVEIKQLNEKNKELIVQLNKQNELLDLKHKQNQQLTTENNKLKEQVDDRELKFIQSMKEKQSLQNEIINMSDILDQTTQRNDQLNSEVFALRLTMEQLQQTAAICKDDVNQAVQKEIRFKDNLDALNKQLKQKDDMIKKLTSDLSQVQGQYKQDIQNKDNLINDLKKQKQQQELQNNEIIQQLIEQKSFNLINSVVGKDSKTELMKMTKEIEELKNQLTSQMFQTNIYKEKEQQYNKQVVAFQQQIQSMINDISKLQIQLKEKDQEAKRKLEENQNLLQDQQNQIQQFQNKIQLLEKQDQRISLQRSSSQNQDEKLLKDLKAKSEQIAMLQKENDQLVKLIESLKNQKIDNQGNESIRVKQLESELKNLSSFIYDSPLVVLFNLLEDRLSKQQQKSFENKNKLKEFWAGQLKQWTEGFEELRQAFNGLKIQFKYELKYTIGNPQ